MCHREGLGESEKGVAGVWRAATSPSNEQSFTETVNPPDCKTSASKSHWRLCRPGRYNAPFTLSQQKPTTSFLSSSSLTRARHRGAPPGASLLDRRIIPITFMTKA